MGKLAVQQLFLMASILLLGTSVQASNDLDQQINKLLQRPVLLKANQIPRLGGIALRRIQVIAKGSDGVVKAIPFQLDEFDQDGFPMVAEADDIVVDGEWGVLDANDEVLFMASDAGSKLSSVELKDFHTLYEVSMVTGSSEKFVYLTGVRALPNHPKHYVHFDQEKAIIKTDWYQLTLDQSNPVIWKELFYYNYGGAEKKPTESLLDTMKVRLHSGVFTRFMNISLSNKHLKARILRVKNGPIRTVIQLEIRVVVAKIPVMKIGMQFHVMPQMIDFPSLVAIPGIFDRVMVEPTMTISLDWNDLRSSEVFTALYPKKPAIVDGHLSAHEIALRQSGINNDENWIAIDTGKNFASVFSLKLPKDKDVGVLSFFYDDSFVLADAPESVLGQGPNMGWKIRDMPSDVRYYMTPSLFFIDSLGDVPVVDLVSYGKYSTSAVVNDTPVH
ncbi:MAG: hypothetical protein COB04_12500 [Gammaproteobacteria bacterium]|nr:MAG: hypothetical protein COB04_12500 [Gammaproteobacteria bacterium]